MKFHDGTPVTANDLVASLNRWHKRRVDGTAMMAAAESQTVKDDLTFELKFKATFGPVLETLANPVLPTFVLRAKDVQGDEFQQQSWNYAGKKPTPVGNPGTSIWTYCVGGSTVEAAYPVQGPDSHWLGKVQDLLNTSLGRGAVEVKDNQRQPNSFRTGEGAAPGCKAASRLCAGEDPAGGAAGADWLPGGCIADCQPAAAAEVVVAGRAAGSRGLDCFLSPHTTKQ